MTDSIFDIAVIGGGINGAGIARDAAGRGLSVLLVEKGDLAGATSSASTKLVHGGLRYLEHYKFRLVREALAEREVLLKMAPHIIWPLRFVLPHHSGLRPYWMIRLGVFMYDHLGGRKILPGSRSVDLRHDVAGQMLNPMFRRGFEYSDGWVDDARLVMLNARDAAARGADIRVRTACTQARREGDLWHVQLSDGTTARARILVNAAGPWVADVLGDVVKQHSPSKVRLVKGSHIVVRRLFDHDRCYIFQNADGRICFAIPYEQDFTLIGTTDLDYHGDPADVAINADEIAYLCKAVSGYFTKPVQPEDVVWSYSGVRPLYDDGASKAQEATRDYVLELDTEHGAPLLSVFGGKITTYRRLAETALAKLKPYAPNMKAAWTAGSSLPGGDFAHDGVAAGVADLRRRYAFLSAEHAARLFRLYGTEAATWLGDANSVADLGICFGADLTEREVEWMCTHEWARTAQDVLWRRSKLGLRFSAEQVQTLEGWLTARG